jgi:hypothetical protein
LLNPKAPKLAPPRETIVAALMEAKRKAKEAEEEKYKNQFEFDDISTFNMFNKQTNTHARARVYRRNSIGNGEFMYTRVALARQQLNFTCFMKRTNSLPSDLSVFRRPDHPRMTQLDGVKSSLSMYAERHRLLEELVDPSFDRMWADADKVAQWLVVGLLA